MVNLKKILALVLVMAMTFSMLPVFAAAEDVAVETVAPVAEAPAAAAPAVEDVAFVPELPQAEATAPVEAIETVAAETVATKAALQADYADDTEAIAAGMVVRLDTPDGTSYSADPKSALSTVSAAAAASQAAAAASKLTLLRDATFIDESAASAAVWLDYGRQHTYTVTDEDGITVRGFWFDLGGHTLTYKGAHPMIGRGGVCQVNLKNGSMIFQNSGRTGAVVGMCLSGVTNTSPYSGGKLFTRYTLKNVNMYSLHNCIGGESGSTASTARNPVFVSSLWSNEINLYNSKAIATDSQGVRFIKSSATISGTALTAYQKDGAVSTIKLHDGSVLGSVGAYSAVLYAKTGSGTTTGIEHKLVLSTDSANDYFLGTSVRSRDGLTPTYVDPEGDLEQTTYSVAMPNKAEIASETTLDAVPGYLDETEVTAFHYIVHVHAECATHHEAADATYTAAGNTEYWSCTCGKYFSDAACENEIEEDSWVIPMLVCSHAAKEPVAEVAPNFAADGVAEHWYCATCEKYFAADGETETTLEALAIPKLSATDAAGKSDEELVALKALMKATAPDGTVTAYTSVSGAINLAAAWTEPGGEVKLLQDYTTVTTETGLLWSTGLNAATYHTDNDPLVGTLYGFWIDLGGHTLTVWRPGSVFGREGLTSVNIKNGKLIHLNANSTGSTSSGIFKAAIQVGVSTGRPYDTSTKEMLTGRITLYNAEIYSISGGTAKYPLMCTFWDAEIRLYDSTAIGNYGVFLVKSESAVTDETALANIQAQGFTQNVSLYGSSILGSNVGNRAISFRTWTAASGNDADTTKSTAEGITHNVNIYADSTARFVGSTGGVVNDNSGSTFTLNVNTPEGCDKIAADVTYQMPSKDSVMATTATVIGVVPENEDPVTKTGYYFTAHVHTDCVTHHEAADATYTAAGNTEYWSCTCGKYFSDAACENEIEEDSWVIPQLTCDHAAKALVAEAAPTFAAAGVAEHWYCETCDTYWAADGETETTAEALAIPQLEPADAEGKTDEQLVALGAVIKAVAPDNTVKAFNNVQAGYNEAKSWTEAGGTLALLTDVLIEDTENNGAGGYMNGKAYDYDNTEVAGMETKGFWFDLGGHTIDARLGMPLFFVGNGLGYGGTAYFNVKNGTILFANNGRTSTSIYGPFVLGWSSLTPLDGDGVQAATLNLYKVNVYALPNVSGAAVASCVCASIMNSTVNVKDSKLICTNSGRAPISFYMTTSTAANDAYRAIGSNFIVNATDGSVIGNVDPETAAVFCAQYKSTARCTENVAYTFAVNAADDTVFLGNAPVTSSDYVANNYSVITKPDFVETARNYAFPAISLAAADYKAWVSSATYAAEDLAGQTTDEEHAKATVAYGETTLRFVEIADAFAAAEKFGATSAAPTLTLNAAPSTYALGAQGASSAFTLDLNGQALPADGLFDPSAAAGKTVTVTMASAGEGKLFAGVPAQTFAANDSFIVEKGHFFTDYSLNLEDSVSINLYTRNNVPEKVYYVQEGKEHTIDAPGAENDWVVNTLAAKQMSETIDAYAVKTEGTITYVDYSKGISVENYAKQDGVTAGVTGEELAALTETLQTMQVYGAYAAKFFAGDASALSEDELSALIGANAAPENYVGNLNDEAFAISDGIGNHVTDSGVVNGYYGSAAVLADRLSLKFYFYGEQFEGAAKVTVGGETTDFTPQTSVDGVFKYVEASVAAKDFDTAITVEFEGVGSVTDSISAYTKRLIDKGDASSNLANALRAYGAAAKAYSDAKNAVTP